MSEKVTIKINESQIRGIKNFTQFSGTEYYSFFGIPYGKAPINNLRFKDPVKVQPWRGTFDATSEKYGCVQYSLLTYEYMGTEDCLFNNIHIPKLPQKNEPLRPVIVNLHPGAYHFGSPHTQFHGSPAFIMHHDVVYVCVSYRLHILGFLNLGLKECSGNQGIKDIVLSLKWIKENIQSFGGDPTNVTLMGSSSGATIIHILMLSPAAKGLFHKAVLMGSYLGIPTAPLQENNQNHALKLATKLGYQGGPQDNKKLLTFLKKQPSLVLVEGCRQCQKSFQEAIAPVIPISVFAATFDKSDILPEFPSKLIESMTKIPIMIGFTDVESAMGFVSKLVNIEILMGSPDMKPLTFPSSPPINFETLQPTMDRNFKNSLRQNYFGWGYHLTDDDIRSIYSEVESFYLNGQPVERAPLPVKMDIQTDISIFDVYDTFINPISNDLPSSVFIYKFQFEGNIYSMNTYLRDMINEPIKGTFHVCDFFYWNRIGDPGDRETRQMVETFTKLITTFAKKGDPNNEGLPIKWRSYTSDNPGYLSINDPLIMIDGKLNNNRIEFWNNIKKKYQIRDVPGVYTNSILLGDIKQTN